MLKSVTTFQCARVDLHVDVVPAASGASADTSPAAAGPASQLASQSPRLVSVCAAVASGQESEGLEAERTRVEALYRWPPRACWRLAMCSAAKGFASALSTQPLPAVSLRVSLPLLLVLSLLLTLL